MKLKWKCALFLLAVMSCQLLVFGSLLSYLGQKDEQADRVSYYNRLLSTISTLSRDVQACELSLFMFVNLQDSNSLSELNYLTHELKTRLDKIDNSWIKQQDSHEMTTILSESRYLSGGFSKLRSKGKTEFEANGSKLDDAFQRGTEIMRAGERLRVRNQQLLSEQTEDDYKDIFIVFVICAFAVNLSATILLFGFFLRTVVSRMDKVTDNFSRLNNDEPLHSRQRGSDEISRLDREFHIMAASLERATMKGSRAFAGTPVGLLTVNDDGMVESMNPCAARMCGEIRDIGSPITPELKSLADIRTHASQKRVAIQSPDGTTFPAEV
ncbi:MAG: PAS domain-containing protein, partial [Cyanobacteria bacterium]|nr:PAS domain-containing protein [Cyanobacteriota bacterium]